MLAAALSPSLSLSLTHTHTLCILLSRMRDKKLSPSASLNAGTLSSSSHESPLPPPPPVLSSISSQTFSLSTSFISMYSPSPRPLCSPAKTLYDDAQIIQNCTIPSSSSFPFDLGRRGKLVSSSKKSGTSSCKWITKVLKLGKLSMEAEEGFLLQQREPEGKLVEKPKKELRFAAKIAVAMDADGFIGVKNSVCADDEVKQYDMETHYCVRSPCSLQRKERSPSKQARPPRRQRRWKLFRRIRRTRVLFAFLFQKVRKAFTSSSKRTLGSHDKFIK